MNQPFETELTSYRIDWRANLINNEYHYIGGDRYNNNETTQIISNTPEWYNTVNTHINLIREHYHYNNVNEVINNIRTELLQYISMDG